MPTNSMGLGVAAGGGGGATTLQTVYNNATPDPEIVTNTTNGALTIRNGREFDADTALTIQNTAGTQTFYVTGDGSVGMNHLRVFLTAIEGSVTGNAGSVTNGVYTNGVYANPDWITSIAWGKITGAPNFTTTSNNLGVFNTTTSDQLRGVIFDETGTGSLVFATSPTLTTPNLGTPTAITLTNGTGLPQAGVTNLVSDLALKAPLASPALTGNPTAPTAFPGTNTTQIATTAFVQTGLATITKGLTIVQTSATTLAPTTGNYYLATETTTVNLPAGNNGDVIGIADGSSNFGTANCTINPNGAQTIAGETSIRLTADNAYVVLAFWGTRWTIIHGNSFVQPDTNLATNILTSGSGTYTPNIAANWLKIRIWGATGGGGGADGQDIGTVAIGGAGGVAGYLEKTILISTGETFTYSVGAAGVGGAAGNNNGTAGGTTSFTGSISGTAQVTGSGGGSGKLGTSSGNSGNSGTGGVATGGDLNQNGARLVAIRWNGGVQFGYSNNVCAFGGDFVTATDSPGVNSTGVGVPGSGGQSIDTIANNAGGNGFSGRIIIEEYI